MAEQQNFRIAFNGFHREDVVRYIEQVNARHAAELSQLNSDMQYLQEKLTQFETIAEESANDASPALEQRIEEQAAALLEQADRIAALERELAEARESAKTAEELLEEAGQENARLQSLLDTALSRQSGARNQQEAELSAYRRAERVERQANQRASQIFDQANGALADATARVDDTAAQIADMAEEAMKQIKQLQLAVSGSKQVLQDTAATLYAIRPAGEDE